MKLRINLQRCLLSGFGGLTLVCCSSPNKVDEHPKELIASGYNVDIYREIINGAEDEYDSDEVVLWMKNKTTGKENKLLKTVKPYDRCWYLPDNKSFYPVSIDSVQVSSVVHICREEPLQLIIEGCPDLRNEYSYFVDFASRKAWLVPANRGFMRETEQGYLLFTSYRYGHNPELGGRYTFIQVFDSETGELVDSLDLEHIELPPWDFDEE